MEELFENSNWITFSIMNCYNVYLNVLMTLLCLLECSDNMRCCFSIHGLSSSIKNCFKGTLSGLRQVFATDESPLKIMKNAFYFTLKVLFILKIFKFLS